MGRNLCTGLTPCVGIVVSTVGICARPRTRLVSAAALGKGGSAIATHSEHCLMMGGTCMNAYDGAICVHCRVGGAAHRAIHVQCTARDVMLAAVQPLQVPHLKHPAWSKADQGCQDMLAVGCCSTPLAGGSCLMVAGVETCCLLREYCRFCCSLQLSSASIAVTFTVLLPVLLRHSLSCCHFHYGAAPTTLCYGHPHCACVVATHTCLSVTLEHLNVAPT